VVTQNCDRRNCPKIKREPQQVNNIIQEPKPKIHQSENIFFYENPVIIDHVNPKDHSESDCQILENSQGFQEGGFHFKMLTGCGFN